MQKEGRVISREKSLEAWSSWEGCARGDGKDLKGGEKKLGNELRAMERAKRLQNWWRVGGMLNRPTFKIVH